MIRVLNWVDERFPIRKLWNEHLAEYYAPKNFNFWYYFGSLAILIFALQIATGIFLTMHYKPSSEHAFASVEYIMRDVPWGWLIRYMHAVGASAFFIVIYLHMFRAILYGSYRAPREFVWLLGCIIYVLLMAESFMGYLLPWGNLSYWGAQVIISLFTALPWIGDALAQWLRGDFVVSDATLNRFFAFHVALIPLVLTGLVAMHILALHAVGSGNPDGVDIKKNKKEDGHPKDGIPFHPYYTVKDLFGYVVFLILFLGVVFFVPEMFGLFLERANFEPANLLQTPSDIVPLWYFTPFYSILRAVTYPLFGIDAKFWGVVCMGLSIVLFFFLPWLDRSPVKSIRYRGWMYKTAVTLFAISFVILGYLGLKNPQHMDLFLFSNLVWAQIFSFVYFGFFVLMPWYTKWDKTKPEPDRVTFK
jgi:ubiquinol-cytochrome c reductase cytochrome b subunit